MGCTATPEKQNESRIYQKSQSPINKCEPAPVPAKIPISPQATKKENIPERKIFKFSLSKKFTLTFDTQLSSLIDSDFINFIYVLSDKRLIIYTENHSLMIVSFNIDKKEWISDFKTSDCKLYYTFACCEINDNQLLTLETSEIKIWKISQNNLQFIRSLTGPFCDASSLIYLGKESLIASASKKQKVIKIWQCEHPFTVEKTIEPEDYIHILYKVKSKDKLIGAGQKGIYIWSTETYKYIGKILGVFLKMSNYIELPNGYLAVSQYSEIKIVDLNTADEYGYNNYYNSKKYIVQEITDDEYITGGKYLDQNGSLFLLDTNSFIYSRSGVLIKFLIEENKNCKMVDRAKDNLLKLAEFVDYDNQCIIFNNKMIAFYGLQKEKVSNNENLEKHEEQEKNLYPAVNEAVEIK